MLVKSITEEETYEIGHAFGYYDYGEETGMSAAFSGKEATANYICAYVRGVLRGGFLHTTGERGEGYIAYKLPKEKMGLKTMWPIACGMLHNSTLKRLLQFGIAIKRGGASLQDRMDKGKNLHLRWTCLCAGAVSGAGLYAKGAGPCLCRGRPAGRAGDPGNRCKKQVRQICASGYETCRNTRSWHIWQAV